MVSEPKFHVGQQVLLKNWRQRRDMAGKPVEIAKIGRKYATVLIYGRELKFDLVTGHAPGESGDFIITDADNAAHLARAEAVERLRVLGFRGAAHDFPRGLSTDALNRIADIAAADLNNAESPDV